MEYAYFIHLSVPDEATSFDDNYFDLEPGESRTIVVTNPRRNPSAQHVESKLVLETRACLGLASLEPRILEPGRRDGLFT